MREVLTGKIDPAVSIDLPTISHMMIIPNEPAVNDYLKSSCKFGPIRKLSIGGKIEIDLETGKVALTDCDLDEASRLFWDAVEVAVPSYTRLKAVATSALIPGMDWPDAKTAPLNDSDTVYRPPGPPIGG